MAYSLGSVLNLKMFGNKRKLFIKKSRYTEMKTGDSLDFEESYEVIKNLFGEGIFKREAKTEELATKEQIVEFNRLTALLNISEERVNKVLTNAKCVTLEEMNREYINKVIVQLQNKIQGEAA